MTRLHACLSIAALLSVLLAPSPATALTCGVFGGDGVTVIGEDQAHPGTAAVCNWNNHTGTVTYIYLPGCDTTTTLPFKVARSGSVSFGSETLAPIMEASINCRDSSTGNHVIKSWSSSFQFGYLYTGYKSKSIVYGTPNADVVYTSHNVDIPAYYNYEYGLVCGYDGDDNLNGDYSTSTSDEECLNGGNGTDICDGDGPSTEASPSTTDTAYRCETYSSVRSVDVADCGCGSAPPVIWSNLCWQMPGGC